MGGGISGNKDGAARVAAELRALKAQNAAIMRALRGLGIQIDTTTGDLIVGGGRSIQVNGGGDVDINNGGALMMTTATGEVVMRAGQTSIPDGSGRTQQSFALGRDDGTVAMYVTDAGTIPGHPHQQSWAFLDRIYNVIFAEDTVSGHGLAVPYLPAGVWVDITSPGTTSGGKTSSTVFQAMQWADCFQQHPRISGSVLVETPVGTSGQVRITCGGVQMGATLSVAGGTFQQFTIPAVPAAWPTFTFGARIVAQLEARVTAGAGTIGVRGMSLWGVGS